MNHNQTMSDKKQPKQDSSCNEMTHFFIRKSRGEDRGPFEANQPHATLLAKKQPPHKFPALGSAGSAS